MLLFLLNQSINCSFDDFISDKATSGLQLEPDWEAILAITSLIRQGDVG